jgi:hypothetical protein
MENRDTQKRSIQSIAKDYFSYLGKHLPQQCASDEFYFFPRSEAARSYLNLLDVPDPDRIQGHVQTIRTLLGEVRTGEMDSLEDEIDGQLLRQNMKGLIREWEDTNVWQKDPTLYVKIPLFAVARVLMEKDRTPEHLKEDLLALFVQVPSFLALAAKNIDSPSEVSLKVALSMTQDAIHFHEQDIRAFIGEKLEADDELMTKSWEVCEAWENYGEALKHISPSPGFAVGRDLLEEILSVSFGYDKSPAEILKMAQFAHEETQEKLRVLGRKISSQEGTVTPAESKSDLTSPGGVVQLYRRQVEDLRRFFYKEAFFPLPGDEKVTVLETPGYLRSLRATASYCAPLTGDPGGSGIFYITPGISNPEMIIGHCPYLSAHETYPGHHLLDYFRIHHPNPVRRQIESPLFYEGWACYGEQLLDEMGYIQDPRKQVVGLKRQLWRDLRAQLDIRLQTGQIDFDRAIEEIESLGYSRQRAQRQVRRFSLTPGYQLCYFVGMHEIMTLRKQVETRTGTKGFHESLLRGGEIPFDLAERNIEEKLHEKS